LGLDGELLGVVVHSGLVLGRSGDVVAAIRRIMHSPEGWPWTPLSWLATSMPKPQVDKSTQQRPTDGLRKRPNGRTAAAQHDSEAATQWEGTAAAERHHGGRRP
jgi:hypothetical protein